jgi:hypothetical protein
MNNIAKAVANLQRLRGIKGKKVNNDVYPRGNWTESKSGLILTKEFLWNLFKKHRPKDFVIDDRNEKVIFTILRYFLKDNNFNEYGLIKSTPSLDKGILIFGDYGVGKTQLFSIINEIGRELLKYGCSDLWFSQISAGLFVENYMRSTTERESTFLISNYYKGKLYIDDLGKEKKAFNKNEIVEELLFERNRVGGKTFVTTNLSPVEISEKYGPRLGDRLPEMFNIISWRGESFRD